MASAAVLQKVMKAQLPTRSVRVRATTANGFLSSYDTVLTQLEVKRRFGEFSLKPAADGAFVPDTAWIDTWIKTETIPQLGPVQCNKAILPDLKAAMKEVTADKLGRLVHTADFQKEGGCFNPRIARFSDGGSVSSHSWGIAVDINVDDNPLGAKPHQDPRLVAIMAKHGFTWGGRWARPTAPTSEWVRDRPQQARRQLHQTGEQRRDRLDVRRQRVPRRVPAPDEQSLPVSGEECTTTSSIAATAPQTTRRSVARVAIGSVSSALSRTRG